MRRVRPQASAPPHHPGPRPVGVGRRQHQLGLHHRLGARQRGLLDLSCTPGAGDPYVAPPPESFLAQTARPPGRLRVALTRLPPSEDTVDPASLAALDDAAALCASLGHEIIDDELPIDRAACLDATWRHWAVSSASSVHRLDQRTGQPGHIHGAGRLLRLLWSQGRATPAIDYLANLATLQATARRVAEWMDRAGYDLFLSPMTTKLPPKLDWLDAETEDAELVWRRQRDRFAYTPLVHHMGSPAMSVPLGWSPDGLPIGSQFCARAGEEGLLLRLAAPLEQARPWRERIPPMTRERS